MDLYTINYIKSNPLVYSYLRENSHWYRELTRDSTYLKSIEEEAKKYYKQTSIDKIRHLSDSINLISSFMDAIK